MTNADLTEVNFLAEKVARVHGDHEPRLHELHAAVIALTDQVAAGGKPGPGAVDRVRAAADDFKPPEWACNSYRRLFSKLQSLTASLA